MQLIGDAVYGQGRLHGEPLGAGYTSLALGDSAATSAVLSGHVLVHAAQAPQDRGLDILCGEAVQGVLEVPAWGLCFAACAFVLSFPAEPPCRGL